MSSASHPQVLKCPECDYYCLSNNQMCRHIYTTQHTLVRCQLCPTLLVCWGFAPGVKKLFDKIRRTVETTPTVDTVEHHMELTQHPCHGLVRSKDAFFVPGTPEMYNVVPEPATTAPPDGVSNNKFRCPDCINLIATWTQMTRHLDATKHSLARCATCSMSLKCYGPAQPQRHEKMTGHRGFFGTFLQKSDYHLNGNVRRRCNVPQYRCHCGITFLEPLHLAQHFETVHHAAAFTKCTCLECGLDGTVTEMLEHCDSHEGGGHHQYSIEGFSDRDYLVRLQTVSHVVAASLGGADTAADENGVTVTAPVVPSGQTVAPPACPNARILYQCPVCWFIFTSWNRLEAHLTQTKHGLSYCCDCKQFLRPRERNDHTAVTGHANLYGPHHCRREYEVMVNMDEGNLRLQVDAEEASTPETAALRVMWHCPHPNCRLLFHNFHMLETHMEETDHGCTVCPTCLETVSVLDGDMRTHEHPLGEIPESLMGVTSELHLQVLATESDLLTASPELYELCAQCNRVVPKHHLRLHETGGECEAFKAVVSCTEKMWDGVTHQADLGNGSRGGSSGAAGVTAPQFTRSSQAASSGDDSSARQQHPAIVPAPRSPSEGVAKINTTADWQAGGGSSAPQEQPPA